MNIYAIVCTRSTSEVSQTTDKLMSFFVSCGIKVNLIGGASSIFGSYSNAIKRINPAPEDIVIFCHDDIEIRLEPTKFIETLKETLDDPTIGFVGPAGTTYLGLDAIWWEHHKWQQGYHRGRVIHYNKEEKKEYITHYGNPDDVVVLDGLFLAAKGNSLKNIDLKKPEYFSGEWDFYDIHYTLQAFEKGYTNKILDVPIVHYSIGELAGRDSWHANRAAFIEHHNLPIRIHP